MGDLLSVAEEGTCTGWLLILGWNSYKVKKMIYAFYFNDFFNLDQCLFKINLCFVEFYNYLELRN